MMDNFDVNIVEGLSSESPRFEQVVLLCLRPEACRLAIFKPAYSSQVSAAHEILLMDEEAQRYAAIYDQWGDVA